MEVVPVFTTVGGSGRTDANTPEAALDDSRARGVGASGAGVLAGISLEEDVESRASGVRFAVSRALRRTVGGIGLVSHVSRGGGRRLEVLESLVPSSRGNGRQSGVGQVRVGEESRIRVGGGDRTTASGKSAAVAASGQVVDVSLGCCNSLVANTNGDSLHSRDRDAG